MIVAVGDHDAAVGAERDSSRSAEPRILPGLIDSTGRYVAGQDLRVGIAWGECVHAMVYAIRNGYGPIAFYADTTTCLVGPPLGDFKYVIHMNAVP